MNHPWTIRGLTEHSGDLHPDVTEAMLRLGGFLWGTRWRCLWKMTLRRTTCKRCESCLMILLEDVGSASILSSHFCGRGMSFSIGLAQWHLFACVVTRSRKSPWDMVMLLGRTDSWIGSWDTKMIQTHEKAWNSNTKQYLYIYIHGYILWYDVVWWWEGGVEILLHYVYDHCAGKNLESVVHYVGTFGALIIFSHSFFLGASVCRPIKQTAFFYCHHLVYAVGQGKITFQLQVNFHNANDAETALDTLSYTNIHGRCCRLMWSAWALTSHSRHFFAAITTEYMAWYSESMYVYIPLSLGLTFNIVCVRAWCTMGTSGIQHLSAFFQSFVPEVFSLTGQISPILHRIPRPARYRRKKGTLSFLVSEDRRIVGFLDSLEFLPHQDEWFPSL